MAAATSSDITASPIPYLEAHSIQQTNRACRKWEIYENTIAQVNYPVYRSMFIRGGTGVVFNNTVTGAFGERTIALDNSRSATSAGTVFNVCDGHQLWDGNADTTGWPSSIRSGAAATVPSSMPLPFPIQSRGWSRHTSGTIRSTEFCKVSASTTAHPFISTPTAIIL